MTGETLSKVDGWLVLVCKYLKVLPSVVRTEHLRLALGVENLEKAKPVPAAHRPAISIYLFRCSRILCLSATR